MADRNDFRPDSGQINLGSLAGAVLGSVGGLFSVGIPPAILYRSVQALFETPKIAVICFVIGGALGWLLGGLIGSLMGRKFGNPWAELLGGVIGGMLPVVMILIWSYHMVTS